MKNHFLLLLVCMPLVLLGQQHKHVPKSAPATYGLYRDSIKIKNNIITYGILEYECKVCGKIIRERHNVDTFSNRRQARYSNVRYKKH